MKMIVSILMGLFIGFALFFFSAYGLMKFFKSLNWSPDILALIGIIFMFITGIFLIAWRMSSMEF